jgi:MinD-like ATPase involved in chromosome partitioning or flagellar assembly
VSAPVVVPVVTAVTGAWEAPLVSGLERLRGQVVVVRRCLDLADLLATAATGQARAVLLSADLRRLDGAALTMLGTAEVAVVGLVEPGDEPAEQRLRQLGVSEVLPADSPASVVAEAVARAVDQCARRAQDRADGPAEGSGDLADPARALPGALPGALADPAPGAMFGTVPVAPGRVVAVWGPAGAPGRTTVAVTLAAELAAAGHPTLVADADTYGGSIAQLLGLLDEAPGLAAAARAADHGTLDLEHLARAAPVVAPGLRVLTGIARPQRWPELRPAALRRVFQLSRLLAAWTVVDCGFSLEQDEELMFDTAAPRRNGATLAALTEADTVLAVGSADPVGLQRLVRGLTELAEAVPGADPVVVVNRLRATAVGGRPERVVRDALARYAGVTQPVFVAEDRPAVDAAVLAGRTLTELSPSSPARLALSGLAARLTARPGAEPSRHATMARCRNA